MADKIGINKQFGGRAKMFRLHYGLDQHDLATLTVMSQAEYSSLERATSTYNIEKLERVSAVYGLEYYEMGNPKTKCLPFNKLPLATQQKIKERKKPVTVYNELDLTSHTFIALSKVKRDTPFVASDIFALLPMVVKDVIKKPRRITDLFTDEFSEYVEKTGENKKVKEKRGRREEYYCIIKQISPDILKEAKGKIAKGDHNENEA